MHNALFTVTCFLLLVTVSSRAMADDPKIQVTGGSFYIQAVSDPGTPNGGNQLMELGVFYRPRESGDLVANRIGAHSYGRVTMTGGGLNPTPLPPEYHPEEALYDGAGFTTNDLAAAGAAGLAKMYMQVNFTVTDDCLFDAGIWWDTIAAGGGGTINLHWELVDAQSSEEEGIAGGGIALGNGTSDQDGYAVEDVPVVAANEYRWRAWIIAVGLGDTEDNEYGFGFTNFALTGFNVHAYPMSQVPEPGIGCLVSAAGVRLARRRHR